MKNIIRKPDSDLKYCAKHDCGIDPKEIINVVAQVPGEADGYHWHWIVQMSNKKYKYITGWCDYTGWGCEDGGEASIEVSTALKACTFAPTKEYAYSTTNIQQQLVDQIKGKQPYGLRDE